MKNALLCLMLLACIVSASASNNPTVLITPSPVSVVSGGTQLFTAAISDGSQVQNCTWLTTGNTNAIQGTGVSTAEFAAGTLKATYIVQATCNNTNNVQAMGIAVVAVR